jgi:uncharacterized protein YbjT (DUF2867 family)
VRVLVTGGTGFTGQRVVRELTTAGHRVTCFVRRSSAREKLDGLDVDFAMGDLAAPESLTRSLAGTEALVNVASLGFGHAEGIVKAAQAAGVSRAVFFSTTAIFTTLPAPSRAVRLAAERTIRDSDLAYTILRPTMIYGAPGDRNVERLFRLIARWHLVPAVGGGKKLIQPVLVDDLARAVAAVLESKKSERRAFNLPGREAVTFREFVLLAARAAGRRVLLLPVPAGLAVAVAGWIERLTVKPRIKAEQILRLLEDKDFEWGNAGEAFGYHPTSVSDGLRLMAERLGRGTA